MSSLIKLGVFGELSREASNARRLIENVAAAHAEDFVITSMREGTHSAGSLHFQGDAFDMRPLKKVEIDRLCVDLGKDYDVINEGDHWHVEYDPKGKK